MNGDVSYPTFFSILPISLLTCSACLLRFAFSRVIIKSSCTIQRACEFIHPTPCTYTSPSSSFHFGPFSPPGNRIRSHRKLCFCRRPRLSYSRLVSAHWCPHRDHTPRSHSQRYLEYSGVSYPSYRNQCRRQPVFHYLSAPDRDYGGFD